MTTQAQATSVRSEIVVDAPVERAFAVFTEPRMTMGYEAPVDVEVLRHEITSPPPKPQPTVAGPYDDRHDPWELDTGSTSHLVPAPLRGQRNTSRAQ